MDRASTNCYYYIGPQHYEPEFPHPFPSGSLYSKEVIMGVNRPREERQKRVEDSEAQEASEAPAQEKPERNPITDPPQGELHTEVEEDKG